MRLAQRVEELPAYLFAEISRKIAEKRTQGGDVISFAIGDPDLPTPEHIIDALAEAARDPANHRYPESEGLPELREAMSRWYKRRFSVELDPQREILPLIGSKEGIGHIALCFIEPGDVALVPDPGYPVYAVGTVLAGGEPYYLPLTEENEFLPDLDAVPEQIARGAKTLWLNYPNNPTGAVADLEFFERAVAFARRYDIAILHDGPYSDVAFDGYRPPSLLQADGARETGIEFHSLSKTYNVTSAWKKACGGWSRCGSKPRLSSSALCALGGRQRRRGPRLAARPSARRRPQGAVLWLLRPRARRATRVRRRSAGR